MKEKTLKREQIYSGKIIDVFVDDVTIGEDKTAKRELVFHNGAVCALAITKDKKIVMVKQFRKPIEQELLEIPAGKLEKDEEPDSAIVREIKEETGYDVEKLEFITKFYTSAGFSNEKIYLYFAYLGDRGDTNFDEDEDITLVEYDIEEITKMVKNAEIEDAKTLVAISLYNLFERR